MLKIQTQDEWMARARQVLPAGGFGNYDPSMLIERGQGSRVWDADGNSYVDYLIGSGPMVLGHGHPEVMEAVLEQLPRGMTFFANSKPGIELAEAIIDALPCAEQVRYVSTGGEADMYAMRLARAFTGRDKIVKFEGGYHGMSAEAQMSLAPAERVNFPMAVPDSAGIPDAVRDQMLIAPFNDAEFARSLIDEHADEIAAVIVEPLQRIIPPEPGFLQALREACDRHGIVLIFDEVVTAFRFDHGGAQTLYGVTPDIATLGKVIGGGFALAAIAGRKPIMDHFDKTIVGVDKWLMQVGTLSGNPVAAAAGLKTIEILSRDDGYATLAKLGERLMVMASDALNQHGIAHQIVGHPTLFDVVFAERAVRDYRDVQAADTARASAFNQALRSHGIFKAPGKIYASLTLNEDDLAQTQTAFAAAAQAIAM